MIMAYARRTPAAQLQPVGKGQKITAEYINKLRREVRHVDEALQSFGLDPETCLQLPCINKDVMFIPAFSVVEIYGGATQPMRYVRRPTEGRLQNVGFTVMGMKADEPGHVLTGGFMIAKVVWLQRDWPPRGGERVYVLKDEFHLMHGAYGGVHRHAENDGAFLVVGVLWKDAVNTHPPWLPDPGVNYVWAIVKQFDFAVGRIGIKGTSGPSWVFVNSQHITFVGADLATAGWWTSGYIDVTPT